MPIPKGYNKDNLEIYYINKDDVRIKVNHKIIGDNIELLTDNLGLYSIVDTKSNEPNKNEVINNDNNITNNKLPVTGGVNTNLLVILAGVAIILGIILTRKKYKVNENK